MPTYPQTSFANPPGALRLTLVRHGQSEPADSDAADFPLKDGHGDPKLTELGERQAVAVAQRLGDESIDAIYVSSLTRTHQTAAPLVEGIGRSPIEEADLREIFLGDWEGGIFRHMLHEQQHPGAIAFRDTYDWSNIPGAESNEELTARTTDSIKRIHGAHADQHVVAFVHGGVIAALCAYATGAHMRGFASADNCGIHRLVIAEDRWFLRTFNDIFHLGDTQTPPAKIVQPA